MSTTSSPSSPRLVGALLALVERARPRGGGAVVLGINGPQGSGKSTLASEIVRRAGAAGRTAVAVSIDDFYWPRAEQLDLARRYPANRYLEHRGYPGTHDVALGASTLAALRAAGPGERVAVPRYDKGAHGGRGDRADAATWPHVTGPVDLVVFEGWMLGFPLVAPSDPAADPDLSVAAQLLERYAPWCDALDAFAHLEATDPRDIVTWRMDAERARRAAGSEGLSDAESRDYVERFLPAYALWVPALRARPPTRAGRPLPSLWARIDLDRKPVEIAEGEPQSPPDDRDTMP